VLFPLTPFDRNALTLCKDEVQRTIGRTPSGMAFHRKLDRLLAATTDDECHAAFAALSHNDTNLLVPYRAPSETHRAAVMRVISAIASHGRDGAR